MPSGPFMLSRTTFTLAGKTTRLRIVVSFDVIFGCRNWALADCAANPMHSTDVRANIKLRPYRTAMFRLTTTATQRLQIGDFACDSLRLNSFSILRDGFQLAVANGQSTIATVSLTLQLVSEFVHDQTLTVTTQGTSDIRPRRHSRGRVFRKAFPTRDALPALDFQRPGHASTTLLPFADDAPRVPYRLASPVGRAPLPRQYAAHVSSPHPSSHCSSILFRSTAAHAVQEFDTLRPTRTDSPNRADNQLDAAHNRRLNEIARH